MYLAPVGLAQSPIPGTLKLTKLQKMNELLFVLNDLSLSFSECEDATFH